MFAPFLLAFSITLQANYFSLACKLLAYIVYLLSLLKFMKLESDLGFVYLQTANNYRNLLEKEVTQFGLHYAQISILNLLWETDGMSQKRIASILALSQPTINKMVKSLLQSGFVKCRQCENDGRKMRVYLTEKGRNIKDDVISATKVIQTKFFSSLSDTEQLILKQIFERLRENSKS